VTHPRTRLLPSFRGLSFLVMTLFLFQGCGAGSPRNGAGETTDSVTLQILGAMAEDGNSATPRELSGQTQATEPLDLSLMGYNRGDPQAPLKVLEVSDFGCGYCRRFHEEIFPILNESYVEAGLVEWKFLPFVLGMFPNGLEAALAAECAGEQDRFFPMQSRLFADQSQWKGPSEPDSIFTRYAGEEGLDVDRFSRCLQEGLVDETLRANIRLGREMGVRGTPTFLIDGAPISGALPVHVFRDILDVSLTRKGLTPPAR